jgi:hypothetical protein
MRMRYLVNQSHSLLSTFRIPTVYQLVFPLHWYISNEDSDIVEQDVEVDLEEMDIRGGRKR